MQAFSSLQTIRSCSQGWLSTGFQIGTLYERPFGHITGTQLNKFCIFPAVLGNYDRPIDLQTSQPTDGHLGS